MSESKNLRHDMICHMITACRKHHNTVDNLTSNLGCHHSQHRLLICLTECGSTPSQKEIAEKLKVSPAAIAVTLKKLEKNGYIARCAAENDSRINEIRITEEGKRILQMTKDIFDAVDDAVCAGISDEELLIMCRCFDKMCDNLNGLNPDAVLAAGKDNA